MEVEGAPRADCFRYCPTGRICLGTYMQLLITTAIVIAALVGLFLQEHSGELRCVWAGLLGASMTYWMKPPSFADPQAGDG